MSPPRTDHGDVEELYEEHGTLVYAIAMQVLKDHQLAEDAAQEAWIRIARQIDKGVQPVFEHSWVAMFARREALRIAEHRQKPLPLLEVDGALLEDAPLLETEDEWNQLRQALSRLPEKDRKIIQLRYLEDVPPAVLRDRLGLVSRNGVSRRLRRAMAQLRRALGGGDRG